MIPSADIECTDDVGSYLPSIEINGDSPHFQAAWKLAAPSCDATRNDAPLTGLERKALDRTGPSEDINTLYSLCAAGTNDTYTDPTIPASEEQIPEIRGMLTLCPKHPEAAQLRDSVQQALRDVELRKNGRMFDGGVHMVGEEIQPGTYVAEGDMENCYWERTDSTGEIIDNNFINAAKRVEVTIAASDYSFNSENCSEWRAE